MDFQGLYTLLPSYPIQWSKEDIIVWLNFIGNSDVAQTIIVKNYPIDGSNIDLLTQEEFSLQILKIQCPFIRRSLKNWIINYEKYLDAHFLAQHPLKVENEDVRKQREFSHQEQHLNINPYQSQSTQYNSYQHQAHSQNQQGIQYQQQKSSAKKEIQNQNIHINYNPEKLNFTIQRDMKFDNIQSSMQNSNNGYQNLINQSSNINKYEKTPQPIAVVKQQQEEKEIDDQEDDIPALETLDIKAQTTQYVQYPFFKLEIPMKNPNFFQPNSDIVTIENSPAQQDQDNTIYINSDILPKGAKVIMKRRYRDNKFEIQGKDIHSGISLCYEIPGQEFLLFEGENVFILGMQTLHIQHIKEKKQLEFKLFDRYGKQTQMKQAHVDNNMEPLGIGTDMQNFLKLGEGSNSCQPFHAQIIYRDEKFVLKSLTSNFKKILVKINKNQSHTMRQNECIYFGTSNIKITQVPKVDICMRCKQVKSLMGYYEECNHIICSDCMTEKAEEMKCQHCGTKTKQGWQVKF